MTHHHSIDPGWWPTALGYTFVAANLVIAAAYLTIAATGARYIRYARTRRSRWAFLCIAGFFFGCVGSHLMMACHDHATPFWVGWHLVQAAASWAAIVVGRRILRDAWRQWRIWERERQDLIHDRRRA